MGNRAGFLLIVCCILAFTMSGLCADDPTPEQLVALHLKSIGDPAVLSQIKSVAFTGTSDVEFIKGWFGTSKGTVILVSEGPKMALVTGFPSTNYRGEYFACDGKAVTVQNYAPGLKSPLAGFLYAYDKIMKNGLLGGVYSNAWPLFSIGGNGAKMKVRKTRVEGAELYEIEYRPKNYHSDMKICLYFDPETSRHVRTDYYLSDYQGYNKRATLTEKFENFMKVGSLTLPHSYTIWLDGWAGNMQRWKIEALEWMFNRPDIDPKIFQANN